MSSFKFPLGYCDWNIHQIGLTIQISQTMATGSILLCVFPRLLSFLFQCWLRLYRLGKISMIRERQPGKTHRMSQPHLCCPRLSLFPLAGSISCRRRSPHWRPNLLLKRLAKIRFSSCGGLDAVLYKELNLRTRNGHVKPVLVFKRIYRMCDDGCIWAASRKCDGSPFFWTACRVIKHSAAC